MVEKLTGQFDVTLDEKGRISLPAALRRVLGDEKITLNPCALDDCLWLFPTSVYNDMLAEYSRNTNPLSKKDRDFRRRLFNSQDVEIDKAGRIQIPQNYRDFASLSKDCLVMGQGEYIEIWDREKYLKYYSESKEDFISVSEEIGSKLKSSKDGNQ
ncbi:MAG: division/cell wall cluster transcriptional repressor MraZ [Treponema sp.]|nr:division/cell wall cluster transcriptional repressor MraZ [Treponema sp.]